MARAAAPCREGSALPHRLRGPARGFRIVGGHRNTPVPSRENEGTSVKMLFDARGSTLVARSEDPGPSNGALTGATRRRSGGGISFASLRACTVRALSERPGKRNVFSVIPGIDCIIPPAQGEVKENLPAIRHFSFLKSGFFLLPCERHKRRHSRLSASYAEWVSGACGPEAHRRKDGCASNAGISPRRDCR